MVWKVLLVIAVILVIVLVALYYFGRKLEKRQAEGQAQNDGGQGVELRCQAKPQHGIDPNGKSLGVGAVDEERQGELVHRDGKGKQRAAD